MDYVTQFTLCAVANFTYITFLTCVFPKQNHSSVVVTLDL